MAGFSKPKRNKRNYEKQFNSLMDDDMEIDDGSLDDEDELDEDLYNVDDEDEEDLVEYKPKKKKSKNAKKSPNKAEPKKKKDNGKFIALAVIAAIGVGAYYFTSSNEEPAKEEAKKELPSPPGATPGDEPMVSADGTGEGVTAQGAGTGQAPAVSMEDMPDDKNPGLPNLERGDQDINNGKVDSSSQFLKDINGYEIPTVYKVKDTEMQTDFVSYSKKRGITGDGVELLWLDAEYKGVPYTIQVPFNIWKELDVEGITPVDIEILHLEDKRKVVSYMKVKDNFKEILEKGEKAVNDK